MFTDGQTDRQTDGQTDGAEILITKSHLDYIQKR